MDQQKWVELAAWVNGAGLAGKPETAMLSGFCDRAMAAGLPLGRALVIIDTLHPVHEGRAFRWRYGAEETELVEYGRTNEGEAAENWRRNPFYRLLQSGEAVMRLRLTPETVAEFSGLADLRTDGMTEYVLFVNRFAAGGIIGEMDCVYSGWATAGKLPF